MSVDVGGTFWEVLERGFPPGGSRRELELLMSSATLTRLERCELLRADGIARRYPCPIPGGDGCPRRVMESEGRYVAVCANIEPECEDVRLLPHDIERYRLDTDVFFQLLQDALLLSGRSGNGPVPGVWFVGTFVPEPGTEHPVYFAAGSARRYGGVLDGLIARQRSAFALLVPTRQQIGAEHASRATDASAVILPLSEHLSFTATGTLATPNDPRVLFRGVGQGGGLAPDQPIATALVNGTWRQLDSMAYQQLIDDDTIQILVDQRTQSVTHRSDGQSRSHEGIQASYFALLEGVVRSPGPYDPTIDPPLGLQGGAKQAMQAARRRFDERLDKGSGGRKWAMIQTVRHNGETCYQFNPVDWLRYALIFAV